MKVTKLLHDLAFEDPATFSFKKNEPIELPKIFSALSEDQRNEIKMKIVEKYGNHDEVTLSKDELITVTIRALL